MGNDLRRFMDEMVVEPYDYVFFGFMILFSWVLLPLYLVGKLGAKIARKL